MESADLDLLEKFFEAEINSAFSENALVLMQSSAFQRAERLVEQGFLERVTQALGQCCSADGYALTHLGRLTYCESYRCENSS